MKAALRSWMNLRTLLGAGLVLSSVALMHAVRNKDTPVLSMAPPMSIESFRPSDSTPTANEVTPSSNQESVPNGHAKSAFDSSSLLATIEAESDPYRRSEALDRAVQSVPDSDLSVVLYGLVDADSPAGAELRSQLARRWAESSPRAAAAWAAQLPEGPNYREALTQVALGWAATDLAGATAWTAGLPQGEAKNATLLSLAYETARTDPLAALELGGTLSPTAERDNLLVHAISQWAAADAVAAGAWAQAVPESSLQQRLVSAVAVALATRDGEAAAGLASKALVPGEEQDRAMVAIAQRWALQSPNDAAAWVAQFPATSARQAALQDLAALLTVQSPGP